MSDSYAGVAAGYEINLECLLVLYNQNCGIKLCNHIHGTTASSLLTKLIIQISHVISWPVKNDTKLASYTKLVLRLLLHML